MTNTIRESTMLIIGMSLFYSYVMSYLHISQSVAEWVVGQHLSCWMLLAAILVLVVVLGFFLPPLRAAGFDLVWFGVVMTIVMEMGLIHPPVGRNLFVIKNIAPDVPLGDVIRGAVTFVVLMTLAIIVLCFAPTIAMWLPDKVIGTTL